MRNYIDRAIDFIKQVFPYIQDSKTPAQVSYKIQLFNIHYRRNVAVHNGLSRIALITSDYVIKYDYNADVLDAIGGCENEVKLYASAKQEGFGYLFAEITPYSYHQHYFYIMPRINGVGRAFGYAHNYMTENEISFCRKYHITDLHPYNYGFKSGHICIIDYACNLSEENSYDDTFSDYIDDSCDTQSSYTNPSL